MSLLGFIALPGELLVALLLCVAILAVAVAIQATRTLKRTRRAAKRLVEHVDPVSGIPSRSGLFRDLRILAGESQRTGTHLLAVFELLELPAYELDHGIQAADELLRSLATRLENAVGRAGGAYSLGRGRFGVLARIGRVSEQVIVQCATAALCDERLGAGTMASFSTACVPVADISPYETLLSLETVEGAGEKQTQDQAAMSAARLARSAVLVNAPLRASALSRGRSGGPALLERGHVPVIPRRPSHDAHPTTPRAPLREIYESEGPDTLALARQREGPRSNPPPRWMPYMRVSTRFRLSVLCGVIWMCLSTWMAWPWIGDLAHGITLPGAFVLIAGIALIPGYLNIQLVTSLLLDHPAPIDFDFDYPALTLLVAAYNEECDIAQTIAYSLDQEYPGVLRVIVIDDGSTDATGSVAEGFAALDDRVEVMEVPHGGKAEALNAGLRAARTPLVATIDADTLLMPDALRRIVSRMLLSPSDTVAVAGSVMVRNSRESLITAAQTWDYFLGIGSIKRQQALLQATLVAQGAFSVYDACALRAAGGWPDCIGEDIVMTWALLERGGRTTYEPSAVAFTEAPVTLRSLARQRRRWARGMIEGLRTYGKVLLRQRLPYVHSIAADILFPYLDLTFTLAFIPGIVMAVVFGDYAIVGPTTLAVLPLNIVIAGTMYRRQRSSFGHAGLRVRQNVVGFLAYLLLYQLLMSPVSVAGYVEELFQTSRRW